MSKLESEINKRRSFAIISHPDAGKTTLTEKLLLFGGAINLAGTVKGRKASRSATSDWMALEQQRGISVTTSVMQFPYRDCLFNLLDTPGHEDFSEDTYRTLSAVDSALMVVDGAKGVEDRTIKLMEVCRLRTTPIITFVNKMDRYSKEPLELLDEIESVLKIECVPMTWPIGMGSEFKGVYDLISNKVLLFKPGQGAIIQEPECIEGLDNSELEDKLGKNCLEELKEEIELLQGVCQQFSKEKFLSGKMTPVYFGSAINNFGIKTLLDSFVEYAPAPTARDSSVGEILANDKEFTGFVFKIQANMDPNHRDRMAFLRVCSGCYHKNMKMRNNRTNKFVTISNALTFMASDRMHVDEAWPGDIIGLHNHGTIQIGDTFSEKKELTFKGVPNFAPELFKRIRLQDPLKTKALLKGLIELSEEGAVQLFRPLYNNDLIVGAVGSLQFDVVKHRLQSEYAVNCLYEGINVVTARWVYSDNIKQLEEFKNKAKLNLAIDGGDYLTYLAPTRVNLELAKERWPEIVFTATREH